MVEEQNTKSCLECGEPIYGRSDKKFCSDQCRNTYNNNLNRDDVNFMRRINHILRKNRRILAKLNTGNKTNVTRKQLLDEGFNFSYFTNIYTTKSGKHYFFCYEEGYLKTGEEWFTLVKRQSYVD